MYSLLTLMVTEPESPTHIDLISPRTHGSPSSFLVGGGPFYRGGGGRGRPLPDYSFLSSAGRALSLLALPGEWHLWRSPRSFPPAALTRSWEGGSSSSDCSPPFWPEAWRGERLFRWTVPLLFWPPGGVDPQGARILRRLVRFQNVFRYVQRFAYVVKLLRQRFPFWSTSTSQSSVALPSFSFPFSFRLKELL